jgi:hypothetical protein
MGTISSRLGLSYSLLTKQAAFRGRISPAFAEALCWVEVTRAFTTPDLFVAGIRGLRHDQCSTHLSYSGKSEDAALVGLEPTTVGCEVAQAFTTPQTSFCKLLSLVNPSIAFRGRSFRSDISACYPKRGFAP